MTKCLRLIALVLVLTSLLTYPAMAAGEQKALTVQTSAGAKAFDVTFPDFSDSTTKYSHDLARTSMVLSYAAVKGAGNATATLTELGFTDAKSINRNMSTILDFAYGTKIIGEKTIIAVVFEDTQSKEEWTAALDFGTGTTAKIFEASANVAKGIVETLIPAEGEFCFWITGFGRGGSSANLLGAKLTDTYGTHSVRSYSFAAPAVSTEAKGPVETSKYNNLFTINNPDDIVTYFPLAAWGYEHYGVVLQMKSFNSISKTSLATTINKNYVSYFKSGEKEKYFYYDYSDAGNMKSADLLVKNEVIKLAPNVPTYYVDNDGNHYLWTADVSLFPAGVTSVGDIVSSDLYVFIDLYDSIEQVSISLNNLLAEMFSTLSTHNYGVVTGYAAGTFMKKLIQNYEPEYGLYFKVLGIEGGDAPYYPLIEFILKHGLEVNGGSQALELFGSINGDTSKLKFRELLTAYEPESYLAWMMATNSLAEISGDNEPVPDTDPIPENPEHGVTIFGDHVLYPDLTLNVGKSVYGSTSSYEVWMTREQGTLDDVLYNPYGPVEVTIPVPYESFQLEFYTEDGTTIEPVYTTSADGKTVIVSTNQLGTFVFTKLSAETGIVKENGETPMDRVYTATNRTDNTTVLYMATYDLVTHQMKTIKEVGKIAQDGALVVQFSMTDYNGKYVKLFLLDVDTHIPVCEAADSGN